MGMSTHERTMLLHAVIRAVEDRWALGRGEIASDRRGAMAIKGRKIVALIGRDDLRLGFADIGRAMRRSNSDVLRLVAGGRNLVCQPVWSQAYVDIVRRTDIRRKMAEPKGRARANKSSELENVELEPITTAQMAARRARQGEEVWPSREWFSENNDRFVTAMRLAHPECETPLREVRT